MATMRGDKYCSIGWRLASELAKYGAEPGDTIFSANWVRKMYAEEIAYASRVDAWIDGSFPFPSVRCC